MIDPLSNLLSKDHHYIFSPLDFFNKSWTWDFNKFDLLPTNKLIVINASSEHWGAESFINQLYDILNSKKLSFVIATHNDLDHLVKPKLLYYPFWYQYSRLFFNQDHKTFISKNNRNFKISCLNHVPRPHRIINYLLLQKKRYAKDIYKSMHTIIDGDHVCHRDDDCSIPIEVQQIWQTEQFHLPNSMQQGFDNSLNYEANFDSYINLVTETTVSRRFFITEKTWKPIAAGQLFLVLGAPKLIAHLRAQGVDTFDDYIDHNYYDTEFDFDKRLEKLHQILDDLVTKDLTKIYQETQNRRIKNAEDFFAGNFDNQYQTLLNKKLNE